MGNLFSCNRFAPATKLHIRYNRFMLSLIVDSGGIIPVIITVAIIGVIAWLIVTYIPMAPVANRVIQGLAVLAIVLVLLRFFGVILS